MFKLKREILAITVDDGPRYATYIPEGATVKVLGGPRDDDKRLVDVRWANRNYSLFGVDLQSRGEEVSAAGA